MINSNSKIDIKKEKEKKNKIENFDIEHYTAHTEWNEPINCAQLHHNICSKR